MPFTKEIPEWNAAGAEPPQSLKDSGWAPDDRPPAEYWNWQMNLTYLALQELQQLAETKGHASKHATGGSDPLTPSDIGAEPTITKNTGFNKNFGTSAGTVSEGNHSHAPSDVGAEPAFSKNTAFNKNFGTIAGTVSEGDHGHTPDEVGLGNVTNDQQATKTEFNDLVQRIGQNSNLSTTDKSTIIAALNEVDQSTKTHQANIANPHNVTAEQVGAEPSFTKNTAFNKDFGTTSGTVAEGNHTHSDYAQKTTVQDQKILMWMGV